MHGVAKKKINTFEQNTLHCEHLKHGGNVKTFFLQNGTLLGSFSCGMSTPINSIEVVLTNPTHILVVTMHVLYLVSGKELQIVWKVETCQGDVLR